MKHLRKIPKQKYFITTHVGRSNKLVTQYKRDQLYRFIYLFQQNHKYSKLHYGQTQILKHELILKEQVHKVYIAMFLSLVTAVFSNILSQIFSNTRNDILSFLLNIQKEIFPKFKIILIWNWCWVTTRISKKMYCMFNKNR